MRLSLRTLAEEAGVSVATVSRALRGLTSVEAGTLARVRAVADRLGYVRDPLLASAFAFARRTDKPAYRETLGFLAIEPPRTPETRPWMAGIWRGISARAAELGYRVEGFQLPATVRAQRTLGRQLCARGIRGLALSPRTLTDFCQLDIEWERFSVVEIGHTLKTPSFTRIDRLLADDMERLLLELHARGYRRIGLAMQGIDEARRHWAVFSACLLFERQNRDVRVMSLFEDRADYTPDGLVRWIKQKRPDVLIGNGPEPLDWLQAAGWPVPSRIGVCRIDCEQERPESGLRVSYETMGSAAVDHLASALERGEANLRVDKDEAGGITTPGETVLRPVFSIPSAWREGTTLRKLS